MGRLFGAVVLSIAVLTMPAYAQTKDPVSAGHGDATAKQVPAKSVHKAKGTSSHSGGDRNCSDFKTQAEAQAFFNAAGPGDPHRLDRNHDGKACDSLR